MGKLTTIKGGLNPKVSLNLYRSLIRSKIEYARTTAAHTPKSINCKITTFQNGILRRCLGLKRSTPIQILYSLAYELTPADRSKLLTAKELIKIKTQRNPLYELVAQNSLVRSSYSAVYHEFGNILDSINVSCEYERHYSFRSRVNIFLGKKSDLSREQMRAILYCEYNEYRSNDFRMFATDASVTCSTTGCGVLDLNSGNKSLFRIDRSVSSLFGELWAIDIACDSGDSKIVIFTKQTGMYGPRL